jgi:acyl carrier protein
MPPSTPIETAITEIWVRVLGRSPIGVNQSFRELGGDSMIALLLLNAVKERFNIDVSTISLFDQPTIYDQAQLIEQILQTE